MKDESPHRNLISESPVWLSVMVTILYFGGTGGYVGFGMEVNSHAPIALSTSTIQNTIVGSLSALDIRPSANTINIGLIPQTPGALASRYMYQVHLTIEYTVIE